MTSRRLQLLVLILGTVASCLPTVAASTQRADAPGQYAVVVSKETSDDPQWNAVVEALARKHAAEVLVYEGDVTNAIETRFPKTARAEFDRWNIETDPRLIGQLAASLGYRSFDNEVKDNVGLLWDRDTVAFYGDPAWPARLAPRELPFDQRLSIQGDLFTFRIDAKEDCTPGRQPAMLLPYRVKDVEIIEGRQFAPLITDNFIMLMEPGKFEKGKTYRVVFRAERT